MAGIDRSIWYVAALSYGDGQLGGVGSVVAWVLVRREAIIGHMEVCCRS